jgi:hypothetical protein
MDPDADPDSAIFVIHLQDANKKEDKNSKRSHKAVGIKVFLTSFSY